MPHPENEFCCCCARAQKNGGNWCVNFEKNRSQEILLPGEKSSANWNKNSHGNISCVYLLFIMVLITIVVIEFHLRLKKKANLDVNLSGLICLLFFMDFSPVVFCFQLGASVSNVIANTVTLMGETNSFGNVLFVSLSSTTQVLSQI